MARSLNKVQLIGNLTRDAELRDTLQGTAVFTFSFDTNRQWKTESGAMKDEAEFHRIVAWDKLAEICSKMLKKGVRTYVEGRLQTRNWTTTDGQARTTTEIVISDMIVLDSRGATGARSEEISVPENLGEESQEPKVEEPKQAAVSKKAKEEPKEEVSEDDIPF